MSTPMVIRTADGDVDLATLCVADIMARWPATMAAFIALGTHCVGCPIGGFHTLVDAAWGHGIAEDLLVRRVAAAIAGEVPGEPEPLPHRR